METVVLVDMYNLYCRLYYPNLDKGYADPSIYGCTYMLQLIYGNLQKYKKIYVVLDSSKVNHEKSKLLDSYKSGREDKKDLFKNFNDFLKIISKLPNLEIVTNEFREADEIIAHIALKLSRKYKVIIYSNDKDFIHLQPLSSNILLSSNFKEGNFKILQEEEILQKFKDSKKEKLTEDIKEIIKWRVFVGDASDSISSAIKGLRKEKIKEIIALWEEDYLDDKVLSNIIINIKDNNLKMKVAENFEKILLNYKLMYLGSCDKDTMLKNYTKKVNINISNEEYIKLLDKYQLGRFKSFMIDRGFIIV